MSQQDTRSGGLIASVLIAITYIGIVVSNNTVIYSNTILTPISTIFIILTVLIIPVCLMASYNNIVHGYLSYIGLLLTLEVILAYLFYTSDLIGFYVAFELALLPLYILVG